MDGIAEGRVGRREAHNACNRAIKYYAYAPLSPLNGKSGARKRVRKLQQPWGDTSAEEADGDAGESAAGNAGHDFTD